MTIKVESFQNVKVFDVGGKRAGLLRTIALSEGKMSDTNVRSSEGAVFCEGGGRVSETECQSLLSFSVTQENDSSHPPWQ